MEFGLATSGVSDGWTLRGGDGVGKRVRDEPEDAEEDDAGSGEAECP